MMTMNYNLTFEQLKNAKPLTKTSLPVKNIVLLAQTPKIADTQKIADKVLEMEKTVGNKLDLIEFSRDNYEKDAYIVTSRTTDNIIKKEMNIISLLASFITGIDKEFIKNIFFFIKYRYSLSIP